eukprot:1144025-Pelagomonas_calceolata.AAC.3
MPALHAQYLLCSRVRLVPTIANGLLEAKLLASFNAPAVNVALSSPMTCGVNKCKCRTDDIESCFLRAVRIQFLCMRACVRACVTATRCCAQMNYSEQMKESSNTHDTLLQLPAPMATGIFLAANVCVCVPWPEVPTESKEQDLMGFRIAHVAFMILPTRRQQNNHFSLSRTKAAKKELCLYAEQLQAINTDLNGTAHLPLAAGHTCNESLAMMNHCSPQHIWTGSATSLSSVNPTVLLQGTEDQHSTCCKSAPGSRGLTRVPQPKRWCALLKAAGKSACLQKHTATENYNESIPTESSVHKGLSWEHRSQRHSNRSKKQAT